MLEMKKNTRAKIATIVASIAALGTIFGVVHKNSGVSNASAQQASVASAPVVAQPGASAQTQTQPSTQQQTSTQTQPQVQTRHTRTRAS